MRQALAFWVAILPGTVAIGPQVCSSQPAPVVGGLRAPVEPVKDRAAKADKVFVGTLVDKVHDGGWARANLRVDEPIKGVKKGDLVQVQWLPKVAGYDAPEGKTGLALLSPKVVSVNLNYFES